ncbi:MAG: hypothetical protein J6252_01725, partial [Clostridia bacterium]|nr:hypothetical protein [Clostridia bacterium]
MRFPAANRILNIQGNSWKPKEFFGVESALMPVSAAGFAAAAVIIIAATVTVIAAASTSPNLRALTDTGGINTKNGSTEPFFLYSRGFALFSV